MVLYGVAGMYGGILGFIVTCSDLSGRIYMYIYIYLYAYTHIKGHARIYGV